MTFKITSRDTILENSGSSQWRGSRPELIRLIAIPSKVLWILALAVLLAHTSQVAVAADKVTICYGAASSALVPLAKLRNFYSSEGIDVEVRGFPSGRQALEAMFEGQCALSTVAEAPVAHYSLSRNDFLIIASISTLNSFERIIVRHDRGIATPADLRGRRIAVAQFTSAHLFLDTFLMANRLAPKDVSQVYLPTQDVVLAFRRGEVDAAALWEPNVQKLTTEFGTKAKVFTAPGLHSGPFLLVGGRDYVRKNATAIERVLRALLRAERFAKEQPATSKTLIATDLGATQSDVDLLWTFHDYRISLNQSLLFALENAARWEIGQRPPAQRPEIPNYLDFIYVDGMQNVKPAVVTIIR